MSRSKLLDAGHGRLSAVERSHIAFIERSLRPGALDRALRFGQRHVGATWIHLSTRRLLHVFGTEHLPAFDPEQSYLLVANHRSFFDLYTITTFLVRRGLRHRLLFPVRSEFFYDRWLGFLVNGAMSFFAMYPPVFRERERLALNVVSLDVLAELLRGGGFFAGMHPEGTRNRGRDPYALLPAQRGVGRLAHGARVTVIPAFVNGLGNDLVEQVRGGLSGRGTPIGLVFGEPVPLDDLYGQRGSQRVHREIAERCLDAVAALGEVERGARAQQFR
ncbi:MAG TPA: lysophospholipid acyltransferase family protein [Polyangiaceae bacterium]|nr:lysophospholipid acyltransferase family protein [Polyangiaceae bacterium]